MSLRNRRVPKPTPARPQRNFIPSQFDADLTMDGTAQSVALAEGTTTVEITNRGASAESLRFAFGPTQAAAEAALTVTNSPPHATTGNFIPAVVSTSDQSAFIKELDVPKDATYYAVANAVASDTQVVSIAQGV